MRPMPDQLYISDSGDIDEQPMTWDGEPMYSPDTVKERLFAVEAFEQLRGQTTLEVDYEEEDHRFNSAPFCGKCGGPCEMTP